MISRILVVEDDEPLIAPLAAQIEAEGYKVVVLSGEQSETARDWRSGFDVAVVNWDAAEVFPLALPFVRLTRSRPGNAAPVFFFVAARTPASNATSPSEFTNTFRTRRRSAT